MFDKIEKVKVIRLKIDTYLGLWNQTVSLKGLIGKEGIVINIWESKNYSIEFEDNEAQWIRDQTGILIPHDYLELVTDDIYLQTLLNKFNQYNKGHRDNFVHEYYNDIENLLKKYNINF